MNRAGEDFYRNAFIYGQHYIALSRVTLFDRLTLLPSSSTSIIRRNSVFSKVSF